MSSEFIKAMTVYMCKNLPYFTFLYISISFCYIRHYDKKKITGTWVSGLECNNSTAVFWGVYGL